MSFKVFIICIVIYGFYSEIVIYVYTLSVILDKIWRMVIMEIHMNFICTKHFVWKLYRPNLLGSALCIGNK